MTGAAKQTYVETAPEVIATMIALVAASATDSFAAEVAKQLYLDELQENLATQLAFVRIGRSIRAQGSVDQLKESWGAAANSVF